MAAETTLIGNATSDPELRYSQGGKAIANLTIAVSDRKFDRSKNEYVDGDTWFARCTVWGEMAEHVAGSIAKGTRVIASGRIGQRDWEDKDGNKRTTVEVTVDAIGPDLRYANAQVTRAQSADRAPAATPAPDDTWASPAYNDETPF